MRAAILVALVGCAHGPAPDPGPGHLDEGPDVTGRTRTVHYHVQQSVQAAGPGMGGPREPACGDLVLAERVTKAEHARELALDIEITKGDDATCGEGVHVTLTAQPNGPPRIEPGGRLPSSAAGLLQQLHAHLGQRQGSFSFGAVALPWDKPARTVAIGGATYLDILDGSSSTTPPGGMSDSTTDTTVVMRLRAGDRALVCAHFERHQSGAGEYGGFRSDTYETIAIDDGACPATR